MIPLRSNLLRGLLAALIALALGGCLIAPPVTVRGVLNGPQLWQGEVRVAGDVILAEDVDLTILPGTRVRFLMPAAGEDGLTDHPYFAGSELIVRGRIRAVGTAAAPIIFESVDPAGVAGSWGGLNLEGSREATFAFSVFRQADSAVHSRDSRVTIGESLFENNLVGVRFHDTQLRLERSLLRNNGAAVRFHFGAPEIIDNRFEENDVNLFVTAHPSDYRIEGNLFGASRDYQVVLGEEVPEQVDLPRNAWETVVETPLDDAFYDGRRDPYLGRVIIDPQLPSAPAAGPTWNP